LCEGILDSALLLAEDRRSLTGCAFFVIISTKPISSLNFARYGPGRRLGASQLSSSYRSSDDGLSWHESTIWSAIQMQAAIVPELSTVALLALGGAVALLRRRK
jgi:hypothetical protein